MDELESIINPMEKKLLGYFYHFIRTLDTPNRT